MNINNDYSSNAAFIVGKYDAMRYTAKQLYLAQLKNGTFDIPKVQEAYNTTEKLKMKDKKSHWLITINCKNNNVRAFKQAIKSLITIKWINRYYHYVFELGDKNHNLHSHMLIRNNQNKKKYSISQIYSKVWSVIQDKNCIDIKSIWNSDVSNVKNYLKKEKYPLQKELNEKFREANNILPIYSYTNQLELFE